MFKSFIFVTVVCSTLCNGSSPLLGADPEPAAEAGNQATPSSSSKPIQPLDRAIDSAIKELSKVAASKTDPKCGPIFETRLLAIETLGILGGDVEEARVSLAKLLESALERKQAEESNKEPPCIAVTSSDHVQISEDERAMFVRQLVNALARIGPVAKQHVALIVRASSVEGVNLSEIREAQAAILAKPPAKPVKEPVKETPKEKEKLCPSTTTTTTTTTSMPCPTAASTTTK